MFLHADSKDFDQTGRFESSLATHVILLDLSYGSSFMLHHTVMTLNFQTAKYGQTV